MQGRINVQDGSFLSLLIPFDTSRLGMVYGMIGLIGVCGHLSVVLLLLSIHFSGSLVRGTRMSFIIFIREGTF